MASHEVEEQLLWFKYVDNCHTWNDLVHKGFETHSTYPHLPTNFKPQRYDFGNK